MPMDNSVRKTAESIYKIMLFLLYRVPPEKKGRFLSKIRGKIHNLNSVEMSQKKTPMNASIGHTISLTKNILNGLNPQFTQQVINELSIILSQKGEKRAMLKSAQIDVVIEPFDSAVQAAVRKIKLKEPGILSNVTKIIVHRGLGGGKLGYVESGPGKDSSAIHLFKTPILEQARRQGGGLSGRDLEVAFEQALVEVIGHEAGHIHGGTGTNKPFGDEHAAGKAAEKALGRVFPANDKPISTRDMPLSKREMSQCAIDREEVGYGDNSGGFLELADPVRATQTSINNGVDFGKIGEGAQGGYGADGGGSYYGLFSIPVGMNVGTVG